MIENTQWWGHLLWILAAGVLGFSVTAVFSRWMRLRRAWFVLPYTLTTGLFFWAYLSWSEIDLVAEFRHGWVWGLLGAGIAGAFVTRNVLAQPSSPKQEGAGLLFDLLWLGVVYGAVDALLLSVLPVLATWQSLTQVGWTESWPGLTATGISALLASVYVTAAYHLGYREFQGPEIRGPIIGNSVMSLAYIVTGNPFSAVLSHIAMHIAAVVHGLETTVQLPPHYHNQPTRAPSADLAKA
jgi:hypothetical protein